MRGRTDSAKSNPSLGRNNGAVTRNRSADAGKPWTDRTARNDWSRRTGQPQRFPGTTGDGIRTPYGKDIKDARTGVSLGPDEDGKPGFSFYRDDDRDFIAGSISNGDRQLSFLHDGGYDDYYYGHGHHGYDDHWVWGGDCDYGYNYPYWGYGGYYPYWGYRHYWPGCSVYNPYYYYHYDPWPWWYFVPSYGYGYVSVYYSDPDPVVVYDSEPYSYRYDDSYDAYDESYSAPRSDSTVIYNPENVYVDDDRVTYDGPAYERSRTYEGEYATEQVTSDGGALTTVRVPAPAADDAGADAAVPDGVAPSDAAVPDGVTPPEASAPGASVPPQAQAAPQGAQAADEQEAQGGWGPILSKGNDAFAAGNYEEARREYARAVLDDPRDGYAKMLSGWAAVALNDYDEAATTMRAGIEASPDLAQYPIDIRILYKDQATFEAQVSGLRQHVAERPDDRDATFVLAYLHYSIGEPDEALALLSKLDADGDPLVAKLRDGALRGQRILKDRAKQTPPSKPAPPQ